MIKFDMDYSVGPLLRRALQFCTSNFAVESKGLDLTTMQFSLLWVLQDLPGVDQRTLATYVNLDRTTCSSMVALLEKKGHVKRKVNPKNKRAKQLFITSAGKKIIGKAERPAQKAQEIVLEALTKKERDNLILYLRKIAHHNNNDRSRVQGKAFEMD